MKLNEIATKKPDGSYAGVKFSDKTNKAIAKYITDNKIPNSVQEGKLHTTLLYSRKYLENYTPPGDLDKAMMGKPTRFEKWPSQPDEDGNVAMCLVLCYDCDDLVNRHKSLMDEHNATYDFDEYKPHVTFSYDVGSLQCKDLPKFSNDIEIVNEYGEDLNLNWAKDNTNE